MKKWLATLTDSSPHPSLRMILISINWSPLDSIIPVLHTVEKHMVHADLDMRNQCHTPQESRTRPDDERAPIIIDAARNVVAHVKNIMDKYPCKEHPRMRLDDILSESGVTHDQYADALSRTGTRKIIMKRETRLQCRINPYNPYILEIWKANMDIQFVENAISAVMYVCSYMMKAEKGMGDLLKRVCRGGT